MRSAETIGSDTGDEHKQRLGGHELRRHLLPAEAGVLREDVPLVDLQLG